MADWTRAFDLIRAQGFTIEPGLTAAELARAEDRFGFRFPPDLAELLRCGLPAGDGFPDWRALDAFVEGRLAWPLEGILFDVEQSGFWLPEWGARPAELDAAKAIATAAVRAAPVLVPLYVHRYLPAEPHAVGNPVLSVYQTDVIYYGRDLASWVEVEWGAGDARDIRLDAVTPIRFWSRLVELEP